MDDLGVTVPSTIETKYICDAKNALVFLLIYFISELMYVQIFDLKKFYGQFTTDIVALLVSDTIISFLK